MRDGRWEGKILGKGKGCLDGVFIEAGDWDCIWSESMRERV